MRSKRERRPAIRHDPSPMESSSKKKKRRVSRKKKEVAKKSKKSPQVKLKITFKGSTTTTVRTFFILAHSLKSSIKFDIFIKCISIVALTHEYLIHQFTCSFDAYLRNARTAGERAPEKEKEKDQNVDGKG